MESFIFPGDYIKQIQSENLKDISGNNQSVIEDIQLAAIEECKSYLRQKYNISKAFNPVVKYDPSKTYLAGNLVYLDADPYSVKAYALNSLALQNTIVYKNTTAITVGEVFNPAKWQQLGNQFDLFYPSYPQPEFNYKSFYSVGDLVFWKDKIYTCRIATQTLDHSAILQINSANTNQIVNIFPDDKTNGLNHWGVGASHVAGAFSTWVKGDNRDQKLLMVCVDIALYHIHSRISPRNIPELREKRYIGNPDDRETRGQRVLYPTYSALGWLQAAAIGNDITPSLELIQPDSGKRSRFGGNAKNINSY